MDDLRIPKVGRSIESASGVTTTSVATGTTLLSYKTYRISCQK